VRAATALVLISAIALLLAVFAIAYSVPPTGTGEGHLPVRPVTEN
jgi:hypothetical protein